MGQIKALDRNVVNVIAAGEVIERPANVVKELVENSIDAGATKITVTIEQGGHKLISVSDNGYGMDADDLACAFESHTTSKITDSSDLLKISTLGFRGEALASIASVAIVKATSRTENDIAGNCIEIDCGDKGSVNACSADTGSTIEVRDIFYKLPARRKFLRTANTEFGHIREQFIRTALAKNNLDMTLWHNGREVYHLAAGQSLADRIAELFSPQIQKNLIELNVQEQAAKDTGRLHIYCLLGKPCIAKTNSKLQYVFLNGRFIRDKFIFHAIKQAYRGFVGSDRSAVIFLFIKMPYEQVDVNVHPTKTEVRFSNPNLVHSQILSCLREKLMSAGIDTMGKLPDEDYRSGGNQRSGEVVDAMADFFKRHSHQQSQHRMVYDKPAIALKAMHKAGGRTVQPQQIPEAEDFLQPHKKFVQVHDSYIIAETEDGFVIIDQHAMQERMIYEQLCRRVKENKLESQKLLIPESLELTESQIDILESNSEILGKLGMEIVAFGPRSCAVQSFPTLLSKMPIAEFVMDLIDLLDGKADGAGPDVLLERILEMAACKAAIKAGQKLSDSEIAQLIADWRSGRTVNFCPHGRPAAIRFSIDELEKQFKRT